MLGVQGGGRVGGSWASVSLDEAREARAKPHEEWWTFLMSPLFNLNSKPLQANLLRFSSYKDHCGCHIEDDLVGKGLWASIYEKVIVIQVSAGSSLF